MYDGALPPDGFQYQPLREELHGVNFCIDRICISIPVPPRGASIQRERAQPAGKNFNTSPSARGFEGPVRGTPGVSEFQYQPLREGLLDELQMNHRPHISIPAPPRGASYTRPEPCGTVRISIPAPPRGASVHACINRLERVFQYQPLHEGLPLPSYTGCRQIHFNTSPSTRGFGLTPARLSLLSNFNTSPSTRGFRRNE